MKRNEADSNVATVQSVKSVQHRRHKYQKAMDGRKQPIRGLWLRNGQYVGRVTSLSLESGKKQPRWVMLKDDRDAIITTLPEARAALERLRTQTRDDELPATGRVPTLASYIPEFIEHRMTLASAGAKRLSTVEKEKALLDKWVAEIGHLRLSQIKPVHILRFRDKLLKAQYSNRTANLAVMALRGLCKHAKLVGHIKSLPMQDIPKLREQQIKRALVTQADIEKLCSSAFKPLYLESRLAKADEKGQPLKNALQFTDYVKVMAYTGARRNETLRLRWSDVDFDRKQITVGSDGQSKNHGHRTVDFNPALEAHFRDMKKRRAPDSEWLFPSPQRGEKDKHAKTFRESLTLAREAAGLNKFGFHDCRHHFISFAVMSGIDYMTIARWVGHKDGGVLIGKVYGHLSNEHAQAQAARLSFRPAIVPMPQVVTG
jgi:integrase